MVTEKTTGGHREYRPIVLQLPHPAFPLILPADKVPCKTCTGNLPDVKCAAYAAFLDRMGISIHF
jgi:hypothetical protein